MGTRSRIGVMHGDVVKSVYCHWDGYLACNGRILLEHYDSTKANELISLGNISALRPNIGEKHAFSQFELDAKQRDTYNTMYGEMTTFYGRDRGETDQAWQVAHTFVEFMDQVNSCDAEYYYIMKDGEWFAGATSKPDGLSEPLNSLAGALVWNELIERDIVLGWDKVIL
jgi:hypothetical protein|tara:strand:+ start:403 stop:912 length:510 start_codon:yes stop_codon:yes gene_type:complete